MTVREIVRWPDARLSSLCEPVSDIDDTVLQLASDMLETMYAATGRGLAAPQVRVLSRVFVMDVTWKEGATEPQVFVNPTITWASLETEENTESCLSIPGISAQVTRPRKVKLRWLNLSGNAVERHFEGFSAVCVQHELDHLNGIVTLDHIGAEDRARALETYANLPA